MIAPGAAARRYSCRRLRLFRKLYVRSRAQLGNRLVDKALRAKRITGPKSQGWASMRSL
jgi:hypothetical protein